MRVCLKCVLECFETYTYVRRFLCLLMERLIIHHDYCDGVSLDRYGVLGVEGVMVWARVLNTK